MITRIREVRRARGLTLDVVARRCQEELRSVDVLGRYGGDEFVVLLPDSATVDAVAVAERVRAAVADDPVVTEAGPIQVHVSLGVATAAGGASSLRALLSQADAALYAAKAQGRDRVVATASTASAAPQPETGAAG